MSCNAMATGLLANRLLESRTRVPVNRSMYSSGNTDTRRKAPFSKMLRRPSETDRKLLQYGDVSNTALVMNF